MNRVLLFLAVLSVGLGTWRVVLRENAAEAVAISSQTAAPLPALDRPDDLAVRVEPEIQWEAIYSEDFNLFVTNLRQAGISEELVESILVAVMDLRYLEALARVSLHPAEKLFLPFPELQRRRDEMERITAEKLESLHGLLGRDLSARYYSKAELTHRIALRYDQAGVYETEEEERLAEWMQRRELAAFLSEREIEEFFLEEDMVLSRDATRLFQPTLEEIEWLRKLANAASADDSDEYEALQTKFGEERFLRYEILRSIFASRLLHFGRNYKLTDLELNDLLDAYGEHLMAKSRSEPNLPIIHSRFHEAARRVMGERLYREFLQEGIHVFLE